VTPEARAILTLVENAAGFTVELFGLSIYRLEDGQFVVAYEEDQTEETFADAPAAVIRFLGRRHELKAGFDHAYPVDALDYYP
jgi:hypothetical protein